MVVADGKTKKLNKYMIPGFFYGLITLICYGTADALASIPAKRMSPVAITLMIDVFIFVFFGVIALFLWDSYQWNQTALVATLGGVSGYIGFLLFVYALRFGKVGVVATIANTYPVITALFGVLVLGEYLSGLEMLFIAVTLLGVLGLTTQFSLAAFRNSDQKSVFLALAAMFFWAGQIIFADYAVNELTPFQVTHISALTTFLVGIILLRLTKQSLRSVLANRKSDLYICMSLGAFYFVGMLALNTALVGGKIGVYSAMAGAGPLVAALFAHYVLGERMHTREWLAVVIIVAGLVGLGLSV